MSKSTAGLVALVASALAMAPLAAHAQLLDQPEVHEPLEPQRAEGDPLIYAEPPRADGWLRACSFRVPACVLGASDGPAVLASLSALERAWTAARDGLRLPLPDSGPLGAYRVYLVDPAATGGAPSSTRVLARDLASPFDRASTFTLIDRSLSGCARDLEIARGLAEAIVRRAVPATDAATARAEASYLARLAVPCAMGLADGAEIFQAHPERAIVDPWRDDYDRGAALFFWWLDWAYGEEPGDFLRELWSISPTQTAAGAAAWAAHPNAFDVLRSTFSNPRLGLKSPDDLFVRFAVARASFGSSGADAPLPEAAALGEIARVHDEWSIDWPAQPRARLASAPVAPTGASYALVRATSAREGADLYVDARWEAFTRMRWVLLTRGGTEVPIAGLDRDTDARATVRVPGAADVVLVGVSLGDRRRLFDPNDGAWEPHGWVLTVGQP